MAFVNIRVIKLLKTETLKKNYQFKNILKNGKYYKGNYIDIYIKKNNKKMNYIGIAVGVKLAKAVKRNRIKRLIRENYRLLEDEIKVGYNIIFICRKNQDIKEIEFNDIKNDIINIFFYKHGIKCKYYPSCSEYMRQAIEKYGCTKGILKGLKRILRCNPFSKGGYDPLI